MNLNIKKQFIRFLIVGILNTAFGYGVYTLFLFLGIQYQIASLAALICGILFSFNTQRKFVFTSTKKGLFIRFVLCWVCIYLLNIYLIGQCMAFGFDAYVSGAIAIIPITLSSYILQRFVVFNKEKETIKIILTKTIKLRILVSKTRLAIVLPCYNEEEVLPETNSRLLKLLEQMIQSGVIAENSGIYYVDDGSRDRTWEIIENFNLENSFVHGIKLSRNRGHQNALLAGLFTAEGDVIVSIDADLQDDINVIKEMVDRYLEGNEIIYGVRSSRGTDTFFKRFTAQMYYRLLKSMGVDLVYNHADYRLMSRKVIDCLKGFKEVNLFLRGIIPQLGFSTATVFFERRERFAGESKYPLRKMLMLAMDGITSFSVVPLRMITMLGLLISIGSFTMVIWIIVGKFILEATIPGWASSVLPIYFIGGIQLLSTGILGEYLSKVYMETKQRPLYFIESVI